MMPGKDVKIRNRREMNGSGPARLVLGILNGLRILNREKVLW